VIDIKETIKQCTYSIWPNKKSRTCPQPCILSRSKYDCDKNSRFLWNNVQFYKNLLCNQYKTKITIIVYWYMVNGGSLDILR